MGDRQVGRWGVHHPTWEGPGGRGKTHGGCRPELLLERHLLELLLGWEGIWQLWLRDDGRCGLGDRTWQGDLGFPLGGSLEGRLADDLQGGVRSRNTRLRLRLLRLLPLLPSCPGALILPVGPVPPLVVGVLTPSRPVPRLVLSLRRLAPPRGGVDILEGVEVPPRAASRTLDGALDPVEALVVGGWLLGLDRPGRKRGSLWALLVRAAEIVGRGGHFRRHVLCLLCVEGVKSPVKSWVSSLGDAVHIDSPDQLLVRGPSAWDKVVAPWASCDFTQVWDGGRYGPDVDLVSGHGRWRNDWLLLRRLDGCYLSGSFGWLDLGILSIALRSLGWTFL